jgi:hypothetical protein
MRRLRTLVPALTLLALFVTGPDAVAEPIVIYTATGSPNDWLLNFSVTNSIASSTHDLYFFGVELPGARIAVLRRNGCP